MLLNILQCTGESPEQRIIWSKMTTVLRLTNPDIDEGQVFYILKEFLSMGEKIQILTFQAETAHVLPVGSSELCFYCIKVFSSWVWILDCFMAKNYCLFWGAVCICICIICVSVHYAGRWGPHTWSLSITHADRKIQQGTDLYLI